MTTTAKYTVSIQNASQKICTNLSAFHDNEVQSILALFLTKPELYKDYRNQKDRQGYFFEKFRKFAENYYNFSDDDESIYFTSTRKNMAGEVDICGGSGSKSGSYSRYFKTRYNRGEEHRCAKIDAFAKKYGATFELGRDPRLFIGVTEIWNKLDNVGDILKSSKWADIEDRTYDDVSFETPIPPKLEKHLVPFPIRNRAMQKLRNQRRSYVPTSSVAVVSDEENEPVQEKKALIQVRSGPFVSLTDEELNDW
jgi:hypothetical protein